MPAPKKTRTTVPQFDSLSAYSAATDAQKLRFAQALAAAREAKKSGNEIRETHGAWLTGPIRNRILKAHGLDSVIRPSYDRQAAKARREAEASK